MNIIIIKMVAVEIGYYVYKKEWILHWPKEVIASEWVSKWELYLVGIIDNKYEYLKLITNMTSKLPNRWWQQEYLLSFVNIEVSVDREWCIVVIVVIIIIIIIIIIVAIVTIVGTTNIIGIVIIIITIDRSCRRNDSQFGFQLGPYCNTIMEHFFCKRDHFDSSAER